MKSNIQKDTAASLLKVIPAKWAAAIIAALIVYVILQPRLNQWFGWKLPSVASLTGQESPKETVKKPTQETKSRSDSNAEPKRSASKSESNPAPDEDELPESTSSSSKGTSQKGTASTKSDTSAKSSVPAKNNNTTKTDDNVKNNSGTAASKGTTTAKSKSADSVEDFLKEVGRNRFESPAGLLYNPGSEEGHRLKHIERHLKDMPDRPGSHGVFEGTMVEFLEAIDDAVTRAKKKVKGTSMKDDDGAIVYEASFDKPIGFLGGEAGKRKRNPKVKKLRVVVRGDAVITAFPF